MIRHPKFHHRTQIKQLHVVITGGTKGLGRAFSKEFANKGDKVFILSRSQKDIDEMSKTSSNIHGKQCNVANIRELISTTNDIIYALDSRIDIWINNAGISGGYRQMKTLSYDEIQDIVSTNLLGTCVASQIAYNIMEQQESGGAIFNLAGAGSNGTVTRNYALYGATKAAVVQFSKTLQNEWSGSSVNMHILSPGMMLTNLIKEGMPYDILKKIEFICTDPDTVAKHLVPRIKRSYYSQNKSYINFLTIPKIIEKIIMRK